MDLSPIADIIKVCHEKVEKNLTVTYCKNINNVLVDNLSESSCGTYNDTQQKYLHR